MIAEKAIKSHYFIGGRRKNVEMILQYINIFYPSIQAITNVKDINTKMSNADRGI